jgi:hypothetical protein
MVLKMKALTLIIKTFILKITTSGWWTFLSFGLFNILFSFVFYSELTNISSQYEYDILETIMQTFIASFTLSVPTFIDVKFFHNGCYLVDITVLVYVLLAYLYVGVLISMLYRKITRT